MSPPWTLPYVPSWLKEPLMEADARDQRRWEEQREDLQGKSVDQLDQSLPRDPHAIKALLMNRYMDVETQEKILEVVLRRAGSYDYMLLELRSLGGVAYSMIDIDEAISKKAYQKLAMETVLNGSPKLFERLSESREAVKNTGRSPATQWMHIMLQDDGLAERLNGDYDGESVERWMQTLPADVRGRAMYHLFNAGATQDNTAGVQVTGVEIPYVGGLQWQPRGDHWGKVAGNVWLGVSGGLDAHEKDKDAFYQASRDADPNHRGIADPRE